MSNRKYDGLASYSSTGVIDGRKDGFECRSGEYVMCVVRMRRGEYGQRVCCASRAFAGSRMLARSLESCHCVALGLGSWDRAREKLYN